MAKSMARIDNSIVANIEWCSDSRQQTETLIDLNDRLVAIGDTYDGVDFYRDGEKVLTPLEEAQKQIEKLAAELEDADAALAASIPISDLDAAYQEGVNSI